MKSPEQFSIITTFKAFSFVFFSGRLHTRTHTAQTYDFVFLYRLFALVFVKELQFSGKVNAFLFLSCFILNLVSLRALEPPQTELAISLDF